MGRFNRNAKGGGGAKKDPVKDKKKKTLEDNYFYVGSSTQASDYEVTANFVINHIKKTYDYGKDIGDVLKELKVPDIKLWVTTLQGSIVKDPVAKAIEDLADHGVDPGKVDAVRPHRIAMHMVRVDSPAIL